MDWHLNVSQALGLMLYSCAFPFGIYLQNHHIPFAMLLVLVNLPFLVLLGPLLMLLEPLHLGQSFGYSFAWVIILGQSYLAFVYLRRQAKIKGVSTTKALTASIGRLVLVSLITLALGGLALVYLVQVH